MDFDKVQPTGRLHTNRELYEKQVELLRLFLEKGAITQAQYMKSYTDLTEKMGFADKKS